MRDRGPRELRGRELREAEASPAKTAGGAVRHERSCGSQAPRTNNPTPSIPSSRHWLYPSRARRGTPVGRRGEQFAKAKLRRGQGPLTMRGLRPPRPPCWRPRPSARAPPSPSPDVPGNHVPGTMPSASARPCAADAEVPRRTSAPPNHPRKISQPPVARTGRMTCRPMMKNQIELRANLAKQVWMEMLLARSARACHVPDGADGDLWNSAGIGAASVDSPHRVVPLHNQGDNVRGIERPPRLHGPAP